MPTFDSIAVKVSYKGKNIIIGKGIKNYQQIINQLQKRFPQITNIKHYLSLEYQEGASSLDQAYNAVQTPKKSIKVKVFEDKYADKTTVIQLPPFQSESDDILSHSVHQQKKVDLQFKEQQILQDFKQQLLNNFSMKTKQEIVSNNLETSIQNQQQTIKKQQPQNTQNSALKLSQIKKHDKKIQIDQKIQTKNNNQSSQSDFPLKSDQQDEERIEIGQNQEQSKLQISVKTDKLQESQNKSHQNCLLQELLQSGQANVPTLNIPKVQEQIKQSKQTQKINQKKYTQQQKQSSSSIILQKIDDSNSLQQMDKQQKSLQDYYKIRQQKLYQRINQQLSKSFIPKYEFQSLKRQFNDKITVLQNNNNRLNQICYDLQYKYEKLVQSLKKGQYNVKNYQKQQQNLLQHKDYKKIPQQEQFYQLNKNDRQYLAQIVQQPKISQIFVGETVVPRFRIKNIGRKSWPQNVYAVEINTNQQIQIKSLISGQSITREFNQQKGLKVGQQIKRTYQLCAYTRKGERITFGDEFGFSIKVVDEKDQAFKKEVQNYMKRNKINNKQWQNVRNKLQQFGINLKTFKQWNDQETLNQIIQSA